MNKTDFTSYISDKHTITKAEAAKMLDDVNVKVDAANLESAVFRNICLQTK